MGGETAVQNPRTMGASVVDTRVYDVRIPAFREGRQELWAPVTHAAQYHLPRVGRPTRVSPLHIILKEQISSSNGVSKTSWPSNEKMGEHGRTLQSVHTGGPQGRCIGRNIILYVSYMVMGIIKNLTTPYSGRQIYAISYH